MWVNRKVYGAMKAMAENNEHDANLFRSLIHALIRDETKIIRHPDMVIMKPEYLEEVFKRAHLAEEELKDVQAELEWYKVKYYESTLPNEN